MSMADRINVIFKEVKNEIKIVIKATKYKLMREMLNKTTFIMNVLFMILNNATFIIQWIIIYSLKDNVGNYSLNMVLLLWGLASETYGGSRFLFKKAFSLSDIIVCGKLDSYLVQPKNVLISVITSDIEVSAIGDMLYGYIILFIYGFTLRNFILFTLFSITGSIIIVDIAIILGSLSFWIGKSDMIADTGNSQMTNFATYPDGIFKGVVRLLLFTLVPVGLTSYIPVWVITDFNLGQTLLVVSITIILSIITFKIFNQGLKRYSSSNLMISKI